MPKTAESTDADLADAGAIERSVWWAEFHPSDRVCSARRAVLDAREALRRAQAALERAEAGLRVAEADHNVRELERELLRHARPAD